MNTCLNKFFDTSPKRDAIGKPGRSHIIGLALLSPGKLRNGIHSTWNSQEELLWTIFDYAHDVATARVVNVWRCNTFTQVESHIGSPFRHWNYGKLRQQLAHTVLSGEFASPGRGGRGTGYEMAAAWGVLEPSACVCVFVCLGSWHLQSPTGVSIM